ncbi:MAG: glutamine amidotransferase [Nitrospirae bacterium]|nr:MAG: glutamine amidotransferase [Nitrospirota bacterium]
MKPMIAIVDYGMGNIRSVEKAFHKIGAEAFITADPAKVRDAAGIVLPGVGAFRDCMANLDGLRLLDTIVAEVRKGKPYLGICLGLQILFSESEGWNTVAYRNRPPICADIPDEAYFYFVHSYYVVPENTGIVAGTTEYGMPFTSMVWKDNVIATQFHPEKSQDIGIRLLKGFEAFVRRGRE